MQKKVIALAVAGLVSGAAFAQSNVTVYGVADVGYTYAKSSSNVSGQPDYKFSGLQDGVNNGLNGSRVGFKGEEALGNGLKAIFLAELRVNIENGDQTQLMRQSFVGLSSASAGTFTLGRQYSAAGDIAGKHSSNSVTTINPLNVFIGQAGMTIVSAGGNSRQSNAVKYVSPNWSGFTAEASYAFSNNANLASTVTADRDAASYSDNGRWALSLDYTNGPLTAAVALAKTQKAYATNASLGYFGGGTPAGVTSTPFANTDPLQGNDINEWYIGGAYDFKVVRIYGTYQEVKNNNDRVIDVTKQKVWSLGVSAPIGNGKIMAEYADIGFKQGNQPNPALEQNGHNKGYSLGYQYDMSKRTSLYGFVSSLKYGSDTLTTTGDNTSPIAAAGGAAQGVAVAGERATYLSAGIRHFF